MRHAGQLHDRRSGTQRWKGNWQSTLASAGSVTATPRHLHGGKLPAKIQGACGDCRPRPDDPARRCYSLQRKSFISVDMHGVVLGQVADKFTISMDVLNVAIRKDSIDATPMAPISTTRS